ncbi:hypothetical protein [Bacillus sp. T33-2]|uniref:hypothetical protein n=1 Tax=Bacillus sp. T33-2 TaxID=2054168 RepID=UPI0015E10F74|nr:hypothetical protein [Bacillus sp. T33-2]
MNNQQRWLPLLASVGIGAAAYYSMRRGGGISKTVQRFVPLASGMLNQNNVPSPK